MASPKVVVITQARIGSTRLPSKVMLDLNGTSLLAVHIRRLKQVKGADQILVATTLEDGVEQITNTAKKFEIDYYQGSTDDVLDRFYKAAKTNNADIVVRLTSDCPLIDPQLIDDVIGLMLSKRIDYCANILKEEFPDGQDVEVMTFASLEKAWSEAILKSDREHVTPFIRRNSSFNGGNLFKSENFSAPKNMNHIRMTVDEKSDLDTIKLLIRKLGNSASWLEYANYLEKNIEEFDNQKIVRNEGYLESLKKD